MTYERNPSEKFPTGETDSTTETERKFLIPMLPESIHEQEWFIIDQGYIAIEEDGTEVRLRHTTDKQGQETYMLTFKKGRGLSRPEAEAKLTSDQFQAFWPATEGRRVARKMRYKIPHGDNVIIELDVYSGELNGLVVAEVEFLDKTKAGEFTPPEWFGDEVTYNDAYKNQHLAVYGLPE